MFVYQNVTDNPNTNKDAKQTQNNNVEIITIILNEQIPIRCPLENAIYLSRKIKRIYNKKIDDKLQSHKNEKETKLSTIETEPEEKASDSIYESPDSEYYVYIDEIIKNTPHYNPKYDKTFDITSQQQQSNFSSSNTNDLDRQIKFYQTQLTLLFNGFDIAISHQYLSQFRAICKNLQIPSFLKQLDDYYELPEIHETQNEITVLRTLENFFFSLTEDNITTMTHQILSLFYQTVPEFFCLILLNQCLIQPKSIELFIYLFEEIVHKIDEFEENLNIKFNTDTKKIERKDLGEKTSESKSLCLLLENIIRKSLKFEGTYGPYRPEVDLSHEMFPQEYFYLCQVLYSRGFISFGLFKESFINANWIIISNNITNSSLSSASSASTKPMADESFIDDRNIKIFITKDQYITIEDFYYDFSDKKCRYKHISQDEVEQLIKRNKNRFIHKINNPTHPKETEDEEEKYVNWISLFLNGDNPDSIADLLRKDDIETFQRFVNSKFHDLAEFIEKYGTIHRSIYERKSVVNKNLTLIEYAAFYGSVKCFKYLLMNECKLDKAAKYAVAGSNSEIIHICQQHKATFEGSLLLSIRFHHWEITEWLLETLNVSFNALAVIKLCINCGNFLSLHFIIEKILAQKSGKQQFIDEIVTVQSIFHLKYDYGYLMTKYKAGVTISFNDNNAIFWHEHFFSYIFDYIKPMRILDEDNDENQNNETKNDINNENEETKNEETDQNNETKKDKNNENEEIKNDINTENENKNDETKNDINIENDETKNDINNENDESKNSETNQNHESKKENERTNNTADKNKFNNPEPPIPNKDEEDDETKDDEFDFEIDYDDEINDTLRKMRFQLFYDIPPEMIELIYILQNHFFQINSIPYRSLSPLHAAIDKNDMKFFKLLKNHSDLDMNMNTYEYPPPLMHSIKNRSNEAFDLLCNDPRVNPNLSSSVVAFISNQYDTSETDKEGNQTLLRMLKCLLKNKVFNPNSGTSFTQQGIFNAYDRRAYAVLEILIGSDNVDLNNRNLKGLALLHMAVMNNDDRLFYLLLNSKRVNVNIQTRLVSQSRDLQLTPVLDKTPLMLCVVHKNMEFFDKLIAEKDIDFNIYDDSHENVLMMIVKDKNMFGVNALRKMLTINEEKFLKALKGNDPKSQKIIQIANKWINKEAVEFIKDCLKKYK